MLKRDRILDCRFENREMPYPQSFMDKTTGITLKRDYMIEVTALSANPFLTYLWGRLDLNQQSYVPKTYVFTEVTLL